jgi:Ca2+-binding RTX toxin-like protein
MTDVNGTNQADILIGTVNSDTISGGNGNDQLSGGAGNDVLNGGNGIDTLDGGVGDDTLYGGNGDDILNGNAGSDAVYGERGDDVIVHVAADNAGGSDIYDGGQGSDTLRLIVTSAIRSSQTFQNELAAFQAMIQQHGSASGFFGSLGIQINSFEHIEVVTNDTNQAPTGIDLDNLSIQENSAIGTVVGTLSATDPDAGDTLTFTLLDNADGRFTIDGTNLVAAGPLDFETHTSHQVTVRVTDAAGAFYDQTFTIGVTNVAGEHLVGDGNPNVLTGGPEDDWLEGLGGNDRLVGGGGNDLLDGGTGSDSASYQLSATGPLTINLAAGTVSGAGVGSDTLVAIEGVNGGNFADVFDATGFSGTSTNAGSNGTSNFFQGNGGDDTVIGNGNTLLQFTNATAGVTVDLVLGTADGNASVGHDTLTGVNAVTGSNFNDVLLGSGGSDRFDGRAGDDYIDGRGHRLDQARYGDDPNITSGITVDLADGIVAGNASIGTDTLRSIETIAGTRFNDIYDATGFDGASLNAGSDGTWNQYLSGQGGNDSIIGNGRTQLNYSNFAGGGVTANIGTGIATYGTSQDTFSGVDSLVGTNAADVLTGSNTGFVPETFQAGGGNDFIDGAGGFDIAMYSGGAVTATGAINIQLAAGIVTGDGSVGTDTLRSIDSVIGTNFDDVFNATGFSNASLNAGEFGDFGTFNNFQGQGGNDTIIGNGTTQLLFSFATGGIVANFQTGTVTGNASVGTDSFSGVSNLNATNFDDQIEGDGNGQGILTFGGNDTVLGHGGDDFISAGDGTDTIDGGAGTDGLFGGNGDDTFIFAAGNGIDRIEDFVAGAGTEDRIDLTAFAGSGIHSINDLQITDNGTDTFIDFGNGDRIVLAGVLPLHEDDFFFM